MSLARLSGLALAVASLAASEAHAVNLNVSASICKSDDLDQTTDIDFFGAGIANVSTSKAHRVECAMPRSPVSGDALFYIDGYNPAGRKTYCGLTSYNYDGAVLNSTQFVISTAGNYDKPINLLAQTAPTYGYLTIACELPPGAKLYGFIAKQ